MEPLTATERQSIRRVLACLEIERRTLAREGVGAGEAFAAWEGMADAIKENLCDVCDDDASPAPQRARRRSKATRAGGGASSRRPRAR